MRWGKLFSVRPNGCPVWAALGTGRADGSNPDYPAREKHAILVMVRVPESEVEHATYSFLQSNGWREPTIENLKTLAEPFHSDDPIMQTRSGGLAKATFREADFPGLGGLPLRF